MSTDTSGKVTAARLRRDAYLYIRRDAYLYIRQQHRVHRTPVRPARPGRRARLARRPDPRHRHRPGPLGASSADQEGFRHLVAQASLGRAGIVLGLECSRLVRNNADWHRLLQICAHNDALIPDEDGLYDPASFNDRLLSGLKGGDLNGS